MTVGGNAGGSVATWDDDFDGDGYEDWPIGWEVVDADDSANEWDFMELEVMQGLALGVLVLDMNLEVLQTMIGLFLRNLMLLQVISLFFMLRDIHLFTLRRLT